MTSRANDQPPIAKTAAAMNTNAIAISVAELAVGIELADDSRRADREAFVAAVLEAVSIEADHVDVASAHGALLAYPYRAGDLVEHTT
jgi:hypothetical protein